MTNPIDDPGFNPMTYRPPNPEVMDRIRQLADEYHSALAVSRELRMQLDQAICDAKVSGHSYAQLKDVTGLGIATIQAILEKHGPKDHG